MRIFFLVIPQGLCADVGCLAWVEGGEVGGDGEDGARRTVLTTVLVLLAVILIPAAAIQGLFDHFFQIFFV